MRPCQAFDNSSSFGNGYHASSYGSGSHHHYGMNEEPSLFVAVNLPQAPALPSRDSRFHDQKQWFIQASSKHFGAYASSCIPRLGGFLHSPGWLHNTFDSDHFLEGLVISVGNRFQCMYCSKQHKTQPAAYDCFRAHVDHRPHICTHLCPHTSDQQGCLARFTSEKELQRHRRR